MNRETKQRIDDIVKHMTPYRAAADTPHNKVMELCHSRPFCDAIQMPYNKVNYYLILGAVMKYRGML